MPLPAAAGAEYPLVAEVDQGVESLVGHQPDITALAAVAAVRTTQGNELLAPEADRAIASGTGVDIDFGFVDEFHGGAQ